MCQVQFCGRNHCSSGYWFPLTFHSPPFCTLSQATQVITRMLCLIYSLQKDILSVLWVFRSSVKITLLLLLLITLYLVCDLWWQREKVTHIIYILCFLNTLHFKNILVCQPFFSFKKKRQSHLRIKSGEIFIDAKSSLCFSIQPNQEVFSLYGV